MYVSERICYICIKGKSTILTNRLTKQSVFILTKLLTFLSKRSKIDIRVSVTASIYWLFLTYTSL